MLDRVDSRSGVEVVAGGKLRLTCHSCGARYTVPAEGVGGRRFRITCRSCSGIIVARCDKGSFTVVPDAGKRDAKQRTEHARAADLSPTSEPVLADTPQPVSTSWYVGLGGKPRGPLSNEDLEDEVEAGRVGPRTYVWRKGEPRWCRARDVPELSNLFAEIQPTRLHQAPRSPRARVPSVDGPTDLGPSAADLGAPDLPPPDDSSPSASVATRLHQPRTPLPLVDGKDDDRTAHSEDDVTRLHRGHSQVARGPSGHDSDLIHTLSVGAEDVLTVAPRQPLNAGRWRSGPHPTWGVDAGRLGRVETPARRVREPVGASRPATLLGTGSRWAETGSVRASRDDIVDSWSREQSRGPKSPLLSGISARGLATAMHPPVARESLPSAPSRTFDGHQSQVPDVSQLPDVSHEQADDGPSDPARLPVSDATIGNGQSLASEDAYDADRSDNSLVQSARLSTAMVDLIPVRGLADSLASEPEQGFPGRVRPRTGFGQGFAAPLPPAGMPTLAPHLLLPGRAPFWTTPKLVVAASLGVTLLIGVSVALVIQLSKPSRATGDAAAGVVAVSKAPSPRPAGADTDREAKLTSIGAQSPSPPAAAATSGQRTARPEAAEPARAVDSSAGATSTQGGSTQGGSTQGRESRDRQRAKAHRASHPPKRASESPGAAKTRKRKSHTRETRHATRAASHRPRRAAAAPSDIPAPTDMLEADVDAILAAGAQRRSGALPTTLTKSQINKVLERFRLRIQACLDRHHSSGQLRVEFKVQPYGRAVGRVVGPLADTAFAACVMRFIPRLTFPQFSSDEPVTFGRIYNLR